MRIATVSDLHLDHPQNQALFVRVVMKIHEEAADLVIVAGDISHRLERLEAGLKALLQVTRAVLFVPGNHELWQPEAPEGSFDSWHRYRVELAEAVTSAGAHYLPKAHYETGRLAVVGTVGWYDYSFLLPEIKTGLDEAQIRSKRFGRGVWNDVRYVCFRNSDGEPMSDPEVARQLESDFEAQLQALERSPQIEEIIAVSHHLPYASLAFRTHSLPWEFFSAYMGSESLGQILDRSPKLRWVVFGHSHVPRSARIGQKQVYNRPMGYPRERRGMTAEEELEASIGWIEVR